LSSSPSNNFLQDLPERVRLIRFYDKAHEAQLLSEAGYDVVEAVDGEDAVSKLSSKSVNVLITDLNMPKVDGIELIRRVRAMPAYKYIPIIMLTTEFNGDKKNEGKAAGATGWIIKPFRPEQLLAVVRKVAG